MNKSKKTDTKRPVVGITMGDPFGNGPEITVKALADPSVYDRCRPIVIGDVSCMEYAVKAAETVSGLKVGIHPVTDVSEAEYRPGVMDVYDLGLVPASEIPGDPNHPQPFGLGATRLGGEASFRYVEKVIGLALEHQVDATVTNAFSKEAINLAVNREELCRIVGEDTEPTYNLVAQYMKDKNTGEYFTDGAEQPFEENVSRAQELLAQAGYPDGEGFPVLIYRYPSLEMDSDTAQVLKEQLKENLNIDIELEAQELQMNYSSRHAGDFDLCRMNWTADFADPYTYLSMLLSNSTYNCSGIRDAEYDSLVARSDSETDPAKRSELLHQAEQLAVGEQFYILPLYAMKGVNLVDPDITGITQNPATGGLEYRYADISK